MATRCETKYAIIGTELYGSPIISTWLDRPLQLAGLVAIRSATGLEYQAITLNQLPVHIPNIAIHLNREINKGFEYNPAQHLRVIMGGDFPESARQRLIPWLCERQLGLEPGLVVQAELAVVDSAPATYLPGGLCLAPRLDNLAGCHSLYQSFFQASPTAMSQVLVVFDHEEIGSRSRSGADGNILPQILERIVLAQGGSREDFLRAIAASVLVSVDAAHGRHPLYPDKHDPDYAPELGSGIVIKSNAQHKYATGLVESAKYAELWKEGGIAVQYFANRPDMGCGSTIGPLVEGVSGIATIDIGIPLWSMHSVRETAHLDDQNAMIRALSLFYGEAP
jgi:aspartyl aminopeptidase